LSINPKDSSDFDMQYTFEKIPLTAFNPYSITYTSYPLNRVTLGFNGNWHVQNGIIKSINHLVLIDPRLHKRMKNKNHKWLPMPLLFYFIRERGNVIDYEIPITGDLKNPKFHLHDVLWDVFENIFAKPINTPYSIVVRNTETEIEKSLTLKWSLKSASILPIQEKFINRMADFLSKNPEAKINVYSHLHTLKEKEYLLLFEAKKMFYLESQHKKASLFTMDDSTAVEKISIKDPLFDQYLNSKIKDALVFTIQEKSSLLLDSSTISTKLKKLSQERRTAFMAYFNKETQKKQIKLATPENIIPYNGFSYYKIVYKGDFLQKLLNAYEQMNELNEKAPRKKFMKRRQETKNKY
jgi:hypothetical protein